MSSPCPFSNVSAEVLGPVFTGAPGTMLRLQAQGMASSYGQHPKSSRCFGVLKTDKRAAVSRARARHLQAAFVVHHLPDTTSSSSSQSLCHASNQLPWCRPWKQSEMAGKPQPEGQQTWVQANNLLGPWTRASPGNWASVSSCVNRDTCQGLERLLALTLCNSRAPEGNALLLPPPGNPGGSLLGIVYDLSQKL